MTFLRNVSQKVITFLRVVLFTILCLPRDIGGAVVLKKLKKKLSYLDKKNPSVSDYFIRWVSETPNKPVIIYNDVVWTFQEV